LALVFLQQQLPPPPPPPRPSQRLKFTTKRFIAQRAQEFCSIALISE